MAASPRRELQLPTAIPALQYAFIARKSHADAVARAHLAGMPTPNVGPTDANQACS